VSGISRDHFVNPYTFVGLGPRDRVLDRREPAGHHTLTEGNYMGEITATLTTRSPLLVRFPDRSRPQSAKFPRRLDTGAPFLPGSSLHGALRAMHEVLAGGCLRVFDRDFLPSYRTPVADEGYGRGWRLGLVTKARGGRAEAIQICGEPHWLQVVDGDGELVDGWEARTTGDQCAYVPGQAVKGRRVLDTVPEAVDTQWGQRLVTLISDPSARAEDKSYWVAFGLVESGGRSLEVSDEAWSTFVRLAEHTEDWRQARRDRGAVPTPESEPMPQAAEVKFRGHLVGYRHRARPWLHEGQVVWVHYKVNKITAIGLARFWRYPGSGVMGDRVPQALWPCDDPTNLCPSCRVFGAAEEREDEQRRRAAQRSYRGHLRVLDSMVTSDAQPTSLQLAPMGQPHPGAGQFYLDQHATRSRKRSADEKQPIARWGESPDQPKPRQMRGRKLYWRTDVDNGRRRDRARAPALGHDGSPEQFVTDVEVLPTGTALTVRIVFDNLSPGEIGGVVAALAPDALFTATGQAAGPSHPHLLSVGGGKPFGFGSVEVSELAVLVETGKNRYVDDAARQALDIDAALAAFAVAVDAQTRALWPELAAATQFGRVDDRLVWYPPGERWPADFDPRHPHSGLVNDHDRGFAFWARSTGQVNVDDDQGDLVVLPDVLDADQRLRIARKSKSGEV
jgi:hypothetical protein